ncbi:MAG TPA: hypothetical protein VFL93_09010 [Longimicrobiaceae bacterium]|nr:hypothetical protein [Longimicrobiaceae bacterium]
MYRNCIFCSADLGRNESIEHFPVGERLAFDAWKGRLWVICPKCARWNLSPLEERWEAVEEAEKCFRDSRLRVQSENIGLSKLPDGTRLIRVGDALAGELAAWRYGDTLRRRRWKHWAGIGGAVAAGGMIFGGMHVAAAVGAGALGSWLPQLAAQGVLYRKAQRPVHWLSAAESPTGESVLLRRRHLAGAKLTRDSDGVALHLPFGLEPTRVPDGQGGVTWIPGRSFVLRGEPARRLLGRAMVSANERGGSRRGVERALQMITASGGPEPLLQRFAGEERRLGVVSQQSIFLVLRARARYTAGRLRGETVPPGIREWDASLARFARRAGRPPRPWADTTPQLALEMALHEESERRAMEGELAALEAAWREAEEIAAIADSLGNDPLQELPHSTPSGPDWP